MKTNLKERVNREDVRDASIGAAGAVVTEVTVGLDTAIEVLTSLA